MEEVPEAIMTPGIREGLASLDTVDMCHLFSMRAVVMKSPPKFLRGAYRSALRIALGKFVKGQQNMMKRGRPAVGNCWCYSREWFCSVLQEVV